MYVNFAELTSIISSHAKTNCFLQLSAFLIKKLEKWQEKRTKQINKVCSIEIKKQIITLICELCTSNLDFLIKLANHSNTYSFMNHKLCWNKIIKNKKKSFPNKINEWSGIHIKRLFLDNFSINLFIAWKLKNFFHAILYKEKIFHEFVE